MKINTRKSLHLTPWELLCALRAAGLADAEFCEAEVAIVTKTEVNEGRTVVASWSLFEKNVEQPDTGRGSQQPGTPK